MYPKKIGIFSKIYNWLKDNWPLALLGVAILFLFARGCERSTAYDELFKKYKEQSKSQQTRIEDLQKIQSEEYEKLDKQIKSYIKEVERIEKEYKEELEKISSSQNKRRKKIIENHDDDPDSLTEAVYNTFGIPIE